MKRYSLFNPTNNFALPNLRTRRPEQREQQAEKLKQKAKRPKKESRFGTSEPKQHARKPNK